MGSDFIGYLEIETIDGKEPMMYGDNVGKMGFIFFKR
jgi:hypothetical protein